MKTITKILAMLAIVSAMIFMDACKGEKGDVGPAGTTGATGTAGATGATGATGQTGATGTANVIYSDWTNVTFTGSGTSWSATINAPKITQEILDKGFVKAYFKFGSSVYEGNYTNTQNGASTSMYYYMTLGSINLKSTFSASYPWRYIIIPGGVAGGRLQELKSKSYAEIKEMFNIPD